MNERNLVAVSIKHTEWRWKFGMPCVLWGHRTKDEEKRSFGGYTQYPNNAEVYSLEDWKNNGYANSPIVSENGIHSACCLSGRAAIQCMTGQKDRYVERTWNRRADNDRP